MAVLWQVIITIFLLYIITIDANRARRLRRHSMLNAGQQSANPNSQVEARQQPLGPNSQGQQPMNLGGMGLSKDSNLGQNQAGRQYYPYQSPYGGYGSQGGGYGSPGGGYGSQGGGYNPYGSGQYSPYNQGMGQYGSYNSPYQGSGGYYSGYNSGSYNRPGYPSNPYQSGGGNYGGYNWNAAQKQNVNIFNVFLSSLLALGICFFIAI